MTVTAENATPIPIAAAKTSDMNVKTISLADTVGLAASETIAQVVTAVLEKYDHLEIGVHLHGRQEQAVDKVLAAYDAGCRRFDSALGGLGGCPFAQDMLVGNVPTERLLEGFARHAVDVPIRKPLESVLKMNADIETKYAVEVRH